MSFKNILVHLDSSLPALVRLQCAIALAKEHSANLIGLYVCAPQHYQSSNVDLSSSEREEDFSVRSAAAGISAVWRSVDLSNQLLSVAQVLTFYAYFSDLVIVGTGLDSGGPPETRADLPTCMVIASGRPILVIPSTGNFESIGKNVMIAWRLGREATRATHDAMPILERAKIVKIVAAKNQNSDLSEDEFLLELLLCHGITPQFETILSSEISFGDTLLNMTSENGSDLLVLGVFSRTHFGALTLGDVGRHLLKHATLPILMSH